MADAELRIGERVGTFLVVGVPGKSPGEVALHDPARRLLVVGDAVIGNPPGRLSLLREQVMDDPARLRASVRALAALDVDTMLVGDGVPVLRDAGARLRELALRIRHGGIAATAEIVLDFMQPGQEFVRGKLRGKCGHGVQVRIRGSCTDRSRAEQPAPCNDPRRRKLRNPLRRGAEGLGHESQVPPEGDKRTHRLTLAGRSRTGTGSCELRPANGYASSSHFQASST